MSSDALVVAVIVGASLVALWVDARFPGAVPKRYAILLLHFIAALAALQVAPPLMRFVPGVSDSAAPATVALMGLFFPALVYVFLSAIWVIRTVQRVLARG